MRRLLKPGFLRCVWMIPLFFGIGAGIMALVRWLEGWDPIWLGDVIVTISLVMIPMGFLAGIGAFDYWARYAIGRPTQPEDHSGHGARSWKDYFRVNTDHKVIGVQYVVTSFFFMLVGGMLAMLVRAELAAPGMQFVDSDAYNGLFSVHASLMIFLFVIPVFAGLANYVLPLMIQTSDAEAGNVSETTASRKLPSCSIPHVNCTFTLLPLANDIAEVTFVTENVELKPPPNGWDGGCSSCAARTVAFVPWAITTTFVDEIGRRSAVPGGAGKVERSTIWNRNRVRLLPLMLMNRRRKNNFP